MKPSVISNGNGNRNPQPQQHQPPHQHQQYPAGSTNTGINPGTASSQDPSGYPSTHNVRGQFPSFSQGFGFDSDMDDIFSDARIRSRLPRMRDPFGTFGTRKRCGIDSNSDPYSHVFEDGADDFFSGFGRRRNQPDFFEFPEEFRQYIPDGFGIPRSGSGGTGRTHQVHPTYQQSNEHPVSSSSQPSYGSQSPQYDNVPQSPKPNLCDASIQTDADLTDGAESDSQQQTKSSSGPKLNKRYSQENEENRGPRSQSAPPHQNEEIPQQQQQQQQPGDEPVYVSSATFSTSAPQSQGKFQKTKSQGTGGMPPIPPQRHQQQQQQQQQPQQQQQQPQSFYLHNPGQGQARQWPPPHPTNTQSTQQTFVPEPQTPGGTIIRTIPIFVEGRKDPIINEHKEIPGQTTPSQQQQPPQFPQPQYQQTQNQSPQYTKPSSYQKQPYAGTTKAGTQSPMTQQQVPPPQPQHQSSQQQSHQPKQTKSHPTVDTHQQIPETSDVPPQTPQTMDCINKIQHIQRDVLHLMEQVESFGGMKNDKDYMYLDEMLTRNLLKLDTIDTNGKDSIRLARKEAIKCIQASINVLEAKAEENARKAGKFEVRHNSIEEEPATEENEQNIENRIPDENPNVLNEQTVIPLPPPPEHNDDKTIKNTEINQSNSSGSQTNTEKSLSNENGKIGDESNTVIETQNPTEKVSSKSKIPIKEVSPTKEHSNAELNREKSRSQSKSPSKSPTKSAAKEGAKKKIIKKIKKLTRKGSKDGGEETEKPETNESGDNSVANVNSNDDIKKTTKDEKSVIEVSEKKE